MICIHVVYIYIYIYIYRSADDPVIQQSDILCNEDLKATGDVVSCPPLLIRGKHLPY